MLMRGPRLDGVHAVDVGCGIGLPGLAAGLRGARVSFLDREATALRFAAFNAAELGIRDFETRVFDWDRDELPASADLLLLADVAYQYRHLAPLRRLCEQVLAVPGGRVLLADPERPTANDLVAALAAHAARVGSAAAEDPSSGDRVALRIVEVGGGPA
jgi:2-polyprenyl-3-methyl-5-hydroxy-6-metoxy-1,4-benzoquinol methylase